MRHRIFLLLWVLFSLSPLFSDNFIAFKAIPVLNQELSADHVYQIEEDDRGILWLGTQNGLYRWNGHQLRRALTSREKPGPGGPISLLFQDYQNRLWVQSAHGNLYYKFSEENEFIDSQFGVDQLGSDISKIIDDPANQRILLLTESGMLYQWQTLDQSPQLLINLGEENLNDAFYNQQSFLMGGNSGFYTIDDRGISKEFPLWLSQPEEAVEDLLFLKGLLYAARGKSGLSVYYPETNRTSKQLKITASRLTHTLDGDILAWTPDDSKFFLLSGSNDPEISELNFPFSPIQIKTLSSGYIIASSENQGVWIYDPYALSARSWPSDQELPQGISRDISSIAIENSQQIWLASHDSGLILWSPLSQKITLYNPEERNLPAKQVISLLHDSKDTLWAGTSQMGLFYLDRNKNRFVYPDFSEEIYRFMSERSIYHIEEDFYHNLWISSDAGLIYYNSKTGYLKQMKRENSLLGDPCYFTLFDSHKHLWIAGESGLYIWDNEELMPLDMSAKDIQLLFQDSNDLIYAASAHGIKIYNGHHKELPLIQLQNELFNSKVMGIDEDPRGNIWFSTGNAILRYNPEQGQTTRISSSSGLLNTENNQNTLFVFEDDSIILGGKKGVQLIQNIQDINLLPPPMIHIAKIELDQRLSFPPPKQGPLKLEANLQFLTIYFEYVSYHKVYNLEIQYRLLGMIDQWTDISDQNMVHLANLQPGTYQFEIRARNASEPFSSPEIVELVIATPLRMQWWFRSIIILLIILILSIISWYFIKLNREVKKRKLAERKYAELTGNLELQIKNRTSELQKTLGQLKQTQQQVVQQEKMSSLGLVVAGVAHEINTPLGVAVLSNSIIQEKIKEIQRAMAEERLTREDLEENLEDLDTAASRLSFNLDRAAALVRNFKQVAVEKNQLDIIEFELVSSIESLVNSLYNEFKRHGVTFKTHLPERLVIRSYPGDISQVITNLLMNSLIHGFNENFHKKEKIISLSLSKADSYIFIRVRDNGIGIAEDIIDKIFNPFFTTNRQGGGTGLGLNIVFNIIKEKLRGEITVDSELGKGTEFVLRIPKEADPPNPTETEEMPPLENPES